MQHSYILLIHVRNGNFRQNVNFVAVKFNSSMHYHLFRGK